MKAILEEYGSIIVETLCAMAILAMFIALGMMPRWSAGTPIGGGLPLVAIAEEIMNRVMGL